MMQINKIYFMIIVMMSFNSMITMEDIGEDDIVMDDAMRHYEEDGLLDPERTKRSEFLKVFDKNKKEIITQSFFLSICGGTFFNRFLIPKISKDTGYKIFKCIKEHPEISTGIVATATGLGVGISKTIDYVSDREKKRAQLEIIKELEEDKKDIEDNPDLNDIVRGIQFDNTQKLLDKAIRKFKGI